MSLKLQIVREIESGLISPADARQKYAIQGRATITVWLRKYGNFDWEYQTNTHMPKTPEQRIMELEAKVKLLEKQKARLEHQSEVSDQKAVIFDMMINLAEKDRGACRYKLI